MVVVVVVVVVVVIAAVVDPINVNAIVNVSERLILEVNVLKEFPTIFSGQT